MYKSIIPAAVAAVLLSVGSVATAEEGMSHSGHYYAVAKLVSGMGDKVTHGVETLDGASSSGFGIDFGYAYGGPWGVELTYSSAKGDVTNDLAVTEQATYTSMGLLGVYTHHLAHDISLVGKLGWMQESEKLAGNTRDDSGIAYVVGAEYGINEEFELVLEYEGTDIKSPKGNAVMAGIKYNY
jgi:opacity protein-like surface antigen